MLESNFKSRQREEFEKMGWKFIQFNNGAGKGFPDTLCLSPTGYHCFVEWKKSKGAKKQSLQEYWNKKLNDMGHDAFFVNPSNVDEWKRYVIEKEQLTRVHAVSVPLPRELS